MRTKHPKWHAMPVSDVENRLKTNSEQGLTPKISRTRLERIGRNELFVPEPRSLKLCATRILSDVSLWVLAFICVIAFCFGRIRKNCRTGRFPAARKNGNLHLFGRRFANQNRKIFRRIP